MRIVHAPAQKCVRALRPGEVKRCMARGPTLVGYSVACPACGGIYSYLNERHAFVEGAWTKSRYEFVRDEDDDRGPAATMVEHPATLSASTPLTCLACRRTITIAENAIEAV